MKWFLVGLVALAIVLAIVAMAVRSRRSIYSAIWPYFAKKPLTAPEQVLYFRLLKALPDHIVLAQVQLSRILGVKKEKDYQSWLNRINQLSADFVICTKDATVLAVIELDDSSHQSDRRKATDGKKDRALSTAGMKVIRWQTRDLPDAATIRSTLLPGLSVSAEVPTVTLARGPIDAG